VEINKIEIEQAGYAFACETNGLLEMASKAFSVQVEDKTVCEGFLVRTEEGVLHAYKNNCPHTGAPLNWTPDQFLTTSGRYIQCSIHGAMFKAETGECFAGPCSGKFLKKLDVVEKNGKAYLAIGQMLS